MKVLVVVELDTETGKLKVEGKGDPLLSLTALDLAHQQVLGKFATHQKNLELIGHG